VSIPLAQAIDLMGLLGVNGYESGFAAFLYKPYGFGELSAALREVLERSRAS